MICLSVRFLIFILLGVLRVSWIYGLMSKLILGKFFVIVTSNTAFVPFFFPSGIPLMHMLLPLQLS